MPRKGWKVVSLAGALLWLLTAFSCAVSHFSMQDVSLSLGNASQRFALLDGFIYCQFQSSNILPNGASFSNVDAWDPWPLFDDWFFPAFHPDWRFYVCSAPGFVGWEIAFPHWLPVLLLTGVFAWAQLRLAQCRARIADGACPVCGYDLRASPDRCPECATPRTAATKAPNSNA